MKKAFTLVELLVVIAIIGILSTLSVVALNSARAKARDARRLSDIKQIRTALDMYYDSAGTYPTSLIPGSPLSYNGLDFLAKVPDDPLSSQHYIYAQTENGQNYTIDFTLETKSAGYEPGNYQATPYAIVAGGSGGVFQCGDLLAYDGGP
ncbi:MAG TPA: prepilin-type N-terminal cleavage/methylation domain-containing protein, partial [bacterium]|nr:prepilin-type N-terminal cleavage/methylation domain-containing protein [bacterium]